MNTHDITGQFRSAASYIIPGNLVKDEHFSLFEAVGALEIGDPKMDSGCLEPGESLDQEFDVDKDLLPEELIWLMDEIFNREVAWLMGYPLSQTLFTSVHIDRLLWPDPKSLDDSTFARGRHADDFSLAHKILRAYCFLSVKVCDCVLSMVTSQHYYEEEDFTTQLFNRELLHRFSAESILETAGQTTDELTESSIGDSLREAILTRLKWRASVLKMLIQHAGGQNPPNSFFQLLHDQLKDQEETHHLGVSVPEAFSTKLQRHLASTVPPRPMVTVSMNQAWAFWRQMIDDCRSVFAVREATHSQDLLTAYQTFAYTSPQFSVYPRALLQSFLSIDGLVASRTEPSYFIQEDLRSLTLPASPLLSTSDGAFGRTYFGSQKVASCMQIFTGKLEQAFINIYRAFCLNNCRIRRTFCHALIEWDALQAEAEEMDSSIHEISGQPARQYDASSPPSHSFSLSSWVYHHKLNLLQLTIQMGFGQMIYAPHELAGMYWYLSNICDTHLGHLERISFFVTAKDVEAETSHVEKATASQIKQQCRTALNRLYRQYAWTKATQLLASTLHVIFIVLQRHGVFLSQGPLYSSDDLRYEIRMKPFLGLSIPEALSHNDFESAVAMRDLSTEELLDQVTTTAMTAKKAWEDISKMAWNMFPKAEAMGDEQSVLDEKWEVDVKDCLKAAIAANICVSTLKKGGNDEWMAKARSDAKIPHSGEKGRWHRWWIVPVLPST